MNKKMVINIFLSMVTFVALKIYNNFSFFNFFTIILYFCLLWFYNYKIEINEKIKKISFITSIIISMFLSLGNVVSKNLNLWNIGFLNVKNGLYIIFMFFGFLFFIYKVLCITFTKFDSTNITKEGSRLTKKEIVIMFLLIFIAWFPFFLRYFPAALTPDSFYVVHNANEKILSDHHTLGFTYFFAIFFYLGKTVFKSLNSCIAVYTIFQMIFMDFIFVFGLNYLSNLKINKKIIYALFAFVALNPLFSHYSITLWRDVLFGMLFVIIVLKLHEYIYSGYVLKTKNIIIFTISLILMLFFRNNGIYVFIFMAPFIVIIGNKFRIRKLLYCFLIISLYFLVKNPLFDYLKVQKGIKSEAYSVPIQQISRVVASDAKIDNKTYSFLENLYDISIVKTDYEPTISDNMKRTINTPYLEKNKFEFYRVYLSLFKQYPGLYFEAYFTQTLGYWYPDIDRWATAGSGESFFEDEVKVTPVVNEKISNIIDLSLTRKIPLVPIIWSIGLNFFILIIITVYTLYKSGFKTLLFFSPIYGVWLSLMIASPVYCEHRYIFSLFTVLPYLFILTLAKNKENMINNKS